MKIKTKSTSEFRTEDNAVLMVTFELREWIEELPLGAELRPIQTDIGSQREPWVVTVGLRASWEGGR